MTLPKSFKAFVLNRDESHNLSAGYQTLQTDSLPEGDVLIKVAYSSLNYKDGLAVTGKGKIARTYPMVAGIDLVGTVVESDSAEYKSGDWVIVTGWGLGERHWGGYAEYARVNAEWIVPLPEGLRPEISMALGTAGVTAMLSLMALEAHDVSPGDGEVVVTGAAGGVGSLAIMLLAVRGYNVVASTGRLEQAEYLNNLGATSVIHRDEIANAPERPLQSERWAGAIDAVGGDTLANVLSATRYGGCVAAYGLAGGSHLNTTVLPFILRGVNLVGIDSVMVPKAERLMLWKRLADTVDTGKLQSVMQVQPFDDLINLAEMITLGAIRGRVVLSLA